MENKPTVIKAQVPGHCTMCKKVYGPGTRIVMNREIGRWVMADCMWPNKKGINLLLSRSVFRLGKEL